MSIDKMHPSSTRDGNVHVPIDVRQPAPHVIGGLASDGCECAGVDLVGLDDARARALSRFSPLNADEVALDGALDRVLCRTLMANEPAPRFANSAMDGYAVRSVDASGTMTRLRMVGEVVAGDESLRELQAGEALRIMTGAPIPPGADAVCMQEHVEPLPGGFVNVPGPVLPGANVRMAGEDLRVGDELFHVGTCLTPPAIGVLAGLGCTSVPVHVCPRIGVLSTGNELVGRDSQLRPGQIRDMNRPALLSALVRDGFEAIDLGIARDDEEDLIAALRTAYKRCDAIILSAGASRGTYDFTALALSRLADDAEQLQVALKPGKPLTLARLRKGSTPVVGLAGNPVAAMVAYELFARPGIRRQAGIRQVNRPILRAIAMNPYLRRRDGTVHLSGVQVVIDGIGRLVVSQWAPRGSHRLHSLALCNALALVPDGSGISPGDDVGVMLLSDPLQMER